ncbi:MAG: DUF4261 domain-containing protein [Pseudomonadota bacterium]
MAEDKVPASNSERMLSEAITAYVLFSEPVDFTLGEIAGALAEDYPALQGWKSMLDGAMDDRLINTDDAPLGALTRDGGEMLLFSGTKGPFPGPLGDDIGPAVRNTKGFPDVEQVVANHRSYLSISCDWGKKTDLASRFLAAQMVTCVSALFAKLPVCVGVYYWNAEHIVPPDRWVAAAESAAAEEWPLVDWVSFQIVGAPGTGTLEHNAGCLTRGMSAFNGHEISVTTAPMTPADVVLMATGAMWQLLAGGHVFKDGDTTGREGSGEKIKIRYQPEEHPKSLLPVWVLFPENSPVDHETEYGQTESVAPPPGMGNEVNSEKGFLSRLLRGRRGGNA